MKVTGKATINVWELFVHDRWDTGCFTPYEIATLINTKLMGRGSKWRVEEPDDTGLDRFVVRDTWDERCGRIKHRMYSVEEVRQAIPEEVARVLDSLDRAKKPFDVSRS